MKGRSRSLLLAAAVGVFTFAVYLPALRNGFVNWDDNVYIFDNAHIRSLGLSFFRSAFLGFYEANWIPLTWTSHAVDYALWGLDPLGHHLTNNLLHAATTGLVVLAVAALLEAGRTAGTASAASWLASDRGRLVAAGMTGVLFGIHPLHVESAAWISERKDLLCAFFFVLSILAYTKHASVPAGGTAGALRPGRWYLLSLGCFILALMSKPMAVTLPAVLLVLDGYPFRRLGSGEAARQALREKIPFFLISMGSAIITLLVQKAGGAIAGAQPSFLLRGLVAVKALGAYLLHMVLPFGLIAYYPYPKDVASALTPGEGAAIAAVAGITILSLYLRSRVPALLAAWSYYLVTLLPVLGLLVQAGTQSMADRYTYLPSLGPFLLAGIGGAWLWERAAGPGTANSGPRNALMAAAAVTCAALTFLTMQQIRVWRNSIDLWSNVIAHEPARVPLAYNNRGLAYKDAGQLDRALADLDTAISLDPDYANAFAARGGVFKAQGQTDQALADYTRVLEIDPRHAIALNDRGMLYQERGQPGLAIEDFSRAVAVQPSFAEAYTNRGLANEQAGRIGDALADYSAALATNPYFAHAYNNRGLLYEQTGQFDLALEDLNNAIRLDPSGGDAYINRGLLFEHLSRFDEAIADYNRAIEIDPRDPLAYTNRAIAFDKTGRSDAAQNDRHTAMSLSGGRGRRSP